MARRPYNPRVENQQLQIQELVVRYTDTQLMTASVASNTNVVIGEPLSSVTMVLLVNSNGSDNVTSVPASSLSIANSTDWNQATGAFLGTSLYGRFVDGNPRPNPMLVSNTSGQPSDYYESGQADTIVVAGVQLIANECLIVKYVTAQ
jgi:hypothetical protein